LREFTRSGERSPYGAPHTASASAAISASTNVFNNERSKSGAARSSCSDRNRAGSILASAVIAMISFKIDCGRSLEGSRDDRHLRPHDTHAVEDLVHHVPGLNFHRAGRPQSADGGPQ